MTTVVSNDTTDEEDYSGICPDDLLPRWPVVCLLQRRAQDSEGRGGEERDAVHSGGLPGVLPGDAGRWIGEVIWITDWPGYGKKGDKVTGYEEWTIGEGKRLLQARFYAGPGSATCFVHYDAGARQIQGRWVSSGGNVWNQVIYDKDGKWHFETTGSIADGKRITGTVIQHISDNGQTRRYTGTMKIDGKELDPLRDAFHRTGG